MYSSSKIEYQQYRNPTMTIITLSVPTLSLPILFGCFIVLFITYWVPSPFFSNVNSPLFPLLTCQSIIYSTPPLTTLHVYQLSNVYSNLGFTSIRAYELYVVHFYYAYISINNTNMIFYYYFYFYFYFYFCRPSVY